MNEAQQSHFFSKIPKKISYQEYCADLIADAGRIKEHKDGTQTYSGAQFEMALLSLKKINPNIDFPANIKRLKDKESAWIGFDWLNTAISYDDHDTEKYYKDMLAGKNKLLKTYFDKVIPRFADRFSALFELESQYIRAQQEKSGVIKRLIFN